MTREDLAALARVSRQAVFYWEQGLRNPSSESLRRLCEALDINPLELVFADSVSDGRFAHNLNLKNKKETSNAVEHEGPFSRSG